MINASAEFIELCQGHGRKWQKILSNEREHRQRLEDMVEQLAKQHSHLENMVRKEIEHHDSEINATNNRYAWFFVKSTDLQIKEFSSQKKFREINYVSQHILW